jgi:HxlR-like helix-turn-helix
MVADGLLTRQRYREVPPRVDYELTERARDLMPVLAELARWGYAWTWSAPRADEAIDIGAILRVGPGLLSPSPSLTGTLEVVVTDRSKDGETRHYQLVASGGHVTIGEEEAADDADARVTGTERAWVAAFGPQADRSGLTRSGDERLIDALLDAIVPAGTVRTDSAAA